MALAEFLKDNGINATDGNEAGGFVCYDQETAHKFNVFSKSGESNQQRLQAKYKGPGKLLVVDNFDLWVQFLID